jgi:DNA-binding transcriptional LysR family regulator
LTESGQAYAQQLEGLLRTIEDVHRQIAEISSAPKGVLKVHSRTMFGLRVLPSLIASFRTQHPDIHIELVLSESPADLRGQQVDIDFRVSPPVEAGVKRRRLFRSERHLVASPKYLASRSVPQKPGDITRHDCLAYLRPGDQYQWLFATAIDAEIQAIPIKPRHVASNGMALLELARLGEGIALLDDYTVHQEISQGSLVRLMPEWKVTNTSFEDGIYATILDTPLVSTKIRLFLDFVASKVSGDSSRFTAALNSSRADSAD